jgi:hypothetical protein
MTIRDQLRINFICGLLINPNSCPKFFLGAALARDIIKSGTLNHDRWSIKAVKLAIQVPLLITVRPLYCRPVLAMAFAIKPPLTIAIWRRQGWTINTVMSAVYQPFLFAIIVTDGGPILVMDLAMYIIPFRSVLKSLPVQPVSSPRIRFTALF